MHVETLPRSSVPCRFWCCSSKYAVSEMRKEFDVGHVVCCRICMVRHYRILTDPTVSKEGAGVGARCGQLSEESWAVLDLHVPFFIGAYVT